MQPVAPAPAAPPVLAIQVSSHLQSTATVGGFNYPSQTFTIVVPDGGHDWKPGDLYKAAEGSPARLPATALRSLNPIEVIGLWCYKFSSESNLHGLSGKSMCLFARSVLADAMKEDAMLREAVGSMTTVDDLSAYFRRQYVRNPSHWDRFASEWQHIRQKSGEPLFQFFLRYREIARMHIPFWPLRIDGNDDNANAIANAIADALSEWRLVRRFFSRLDPKYVEGNSRAMLLREISDRIAFLRVDDAALTHDQKFGITFLALERALEDPLNSAIFTISGSSRNPENYKPNKRDGKEDESKSASRGYKGSGGGQSRQFGNHKGHKNHKGAHDSGQHKHSQSASTSQSPPIICNACNAPGHKAPVCNNQAAKDAYYAKKHGSTSSAPANKAKPVKDPNFFKKKVKQAAIAYAKASGQDVDDILKFQGDTFSIKFGVNKSSTLPDDGSELDGKEEEMPRRVTGPLIQLPNGETRSTAQYFTDANNETAEAIVGAVTYSEFSMDVFKPAPFRSVVLDASAPLTMNVKSTNVVPKLAILIDNFYVVALLDSGSQATLMGKNTARHVGIPMTPTQLPMSIVGVGGAKTRVVGTLPLVPTRIGEVTLPLNWLVVDDENFGEPIISHEDLIRFDFAPSRDRNFIECGNVMFHLSSDGIFTPRQMALVDNYMSGDPKLEDEGIEAIMGEMETNTITLSPSPTASPMKAHAGDHRSSLPDLPESRPFDSTWPQEQQFKWIFAAFSGLDVTFGESSLLEISKSPPAVLLKLSLVYMELRKSSVLANQTPLPFLLDDHGEPCLFDINLVNGNEDTFRYIAPARNHSSAKRQVISQSVDIYKELGVIEELPPGAKPRVVLENVLAATAGGTFRCCTDATPINAHTITEPMLKMGGMGDHFVGIEGPKLVKYQICVDIVKAFNLIKCTENASNLLTVRGTSSFFRWLRMPFGPKNAPACWQLHTADLVHDMSGNARKQVDDIWLFASSLDEVLDVFLRLLQRCNRRNVPIKPSKTQMLQEETKFSGRLIDRNGFMSPLRDHLARLLDMKNPASDMASARCLLGIAHWISGYVPGMAMLLEPFAALLRSKDGLSGPLDLDKLRDALIVLQQHVREHVKLRILDSSKPVAIFCDACETGVAGLVLQPVKPEEFLKGNFTSGFHIVAADSKLLSSGQRRWPVMDWEAYALIYTLNQFRDLVYGMEIHLFSDHRPLRYIFARALSEKSPARLYRWMMALQGWELFLEYFPGRRNTAADIFSRFVMQFDPKEGYISCFDGETQQEYMKFTSLMESSSASRSVLRGAATETQVKQVKALSSTPLVAATSTVSSDSDAAVNLPQSWLEAMSQDKFAVITLAVLNSEPIPAKAGDNLISRVEEEEVLAILEKHRLSISHIGNSIFFQGAMDFLKRRYVPITLRRTMFRLYHDSIHAGHPGPERCLESLSRTCWWPSMKKDVTLWCQQCHRCQLGKPGGTTLDFMRGSSARATYPFHTVIVDVYGKLTTTERGNSYCIIFVDEATTFEVGVVSPTNDAVSVARALVQTIMVFGAPLVIKSDRGPEFVNALIAALCDLLAVTQETTVPYSPHGVALNERKHLEAANYYRTLGVQDDWDLAFPIALFVRNNRYNRGIGSTPFRAMFGRDCINVYDAGMVAMLSRQLNDPVLGSLPIADWAARMQSDTAQREARRRLLELQEQARFAKKRGKGADKQSVAIGDLVAIRSVPSKSGSLGAKLQNKWFGPFKVIHCSPNGLNITAEYLEDTAIVVQRPASDVKRYYASDTFLQDRIFNDQEFEFEEILDARGDTDNREYLVQWSNYPAEFNSWLPREDINSLAKLEEADAKFPPPDQLALALEPMPRRNVPAADWIVNLDPSDIRHIIGSRDTRNGTTIELSLNSDKEGFTRRILAKDLPDWLRRHPKVRDLISGN